ncbi:hypothetical protein CEXT_372461 [Caerostris extrusa]|uniref:Uncharacterized protein n=1 Tax=Caerostris extrusa TaxID=172846 RepID=A0AAV4XT66_CAEEX|nr:hypothetical protein CEXT_372461 [Caerostris extrusa]
MKHAKYLSAINALSRKKKHLFNWSQSTLLICYRIPPGQMEVLLPFPSLPIDSLPIFANLNSLPMMITKIPSFNLVHNHDDTIIQCHPKSLCYHDSTDL